ncbi:DUF3500 domain-containing protein [Edaphobacter aggregans]|uniref:DUF3500 domain-containing protein n=1 Tax=Edaphobacter aggregans TaxID=570835 RepID=UPI0009FD2D1B|nr:DUF3500 domain-containing protein [Edaphobacter aggregans]
MQVVPASRVRFVADGTRSNCRARCSRPGLSQTGYVKAVTIMSLEDVLKALENDNGERRDPEKYHFTVFGTPSGMGTWGWRSRSTTCFG